MNSHRTDIVLMCFERLGLLHGVVVEDTDEEIIRTAGEGVEAGDEAGDTDGIAGLDDVEGFHKGGGFEVPDGDLTGVESAENERFFGVDFDTLDTFRTCLKDTSHRLRFGHGLSFFFLNKFY